MSDTVDPQVLSVTPRKLSPFKRLSNKVMSSFKTMFDNSNSDATDLAPGSVDIAHDSRERKSHSSHSKKSHGPTELAAQLSGMELENTEDMKVPRCLLHPQRPSDQGKLTVVLDMDETLIHTEFTGKPHLDYRQAEDRLNVSGRREPDFSVVLYEDDPNQQPEVVHVYKRPGLDTFLAKLSEICEPVIFTASLPMYARPILKAVDPKRRCKSRLYRNATTKYMGYPHVKCLSHIGRDLARTILVDNSPFAMCADPDNAIPIKSYYDDPEDRELEYLFEIIKEMVILNLEDVRPHLRRKFNFGAVLSSIMPAPVSPVSSVPQ